jgi:hypothetical protein
MKLVAYCPRGMIDSIDLLAAKVPVGEVDDWVWINALADRVVELAERESNPDVAAEWACKSLKCVRVDNHNQLGQIIVLDNDDLRSHINLSFDEYPFPDLVERDDEEALEAIEATDLEQWVHCAQYLIGDGGMETSLKEYLEGHESVRDEEIRSYIEYLERHSLAALCDAELYDSDSCEFWLPVYDMTFYFDHKYECARIDYLVRPKDGSEFKSLAELDERLKSFNNNHATKLSYHFNLVKNWFSKNSYKPSYYFLRLEAPLVNEPEEVNKFFTTFYEDILSFFSCEEFDVSKPALRVDAKRDESFESYLENQITYLRLLRKYPDQLNALKID